MSLINELVNKQKLIRRVIVIWAAALITWICYVVFKDIKAITAVVVSALATMTALLGVPIGYYFHDRSKDKGEEEGK